MKKKILIIIGIIVAIIVAAGLVTSYIDMARVRNSVEPKYTLKIVTDGGNKVTYWGLGYKVVRYPAVSPNEPYKNNLGVKYGSWFMNYELEEDDYNMKEFINSKIKYVIFITNINELDEEWRIYEVFDNKNKVITTCKVGEENNLDVVLHCDNDFGTVTLKNRKKT